MYRYCAWFEVSKGIKSQFSRLAVCIRTKQNRPHLLFPKTIIQKNWRIDNQCRLCLTASQLITNIDVLDMASEAVSLLKDIGAAGPRIKPMTFIFSELQLPDDKWSISFYEREFSTWRWEARFQGAQGSGVRANTTPIVRFSGRPEPSTNLQYYRVCMHGMCLWARRRMKPHGHVGPLAMLLDAHHFIFYQPSFLENPEIDKKLSVHYCQCQVQQRLSLNLFFVKADTRLENHIHHQPAWNETNKHNGAIGHRHTASVLMKTWYALDESFHTSH